MTWRGVLCQERETTLFWVHLLVRLKILIIFYFSFLGFYMCMHLENHTSTIKFWIKINNSAKGKTHSELINYD